MRKRFKQDEMPVTVKDKVLDVDASMQGTLSFNDPVNLRINGRFEGKLNTKGSLMLGERAEVLAEMVGESITIAGKVKGNIRATKDLKLISPAMVEGNIYTPVLSVAEGAVINGKIEMISGKGMSAAAVQQMLSTEEVAKYLEIEKDLVEDWADNGRLPGVKEGDIWRFDKAILDRWVSNEKIN